MMLYDTKKGSPHVQDFLLRFLQLYTLHDYMKNKYLEILKYVFVIHLEYFNIA